MMKLGRAIRVVAIAVGVVVLVGVVAAVTVGGAGVALLAILAPTMCGTDLVSTSYSPDRRWKVDTDVINCGATTDFGTQIFLQPGPKAPFWESWRGKTLVVEFDSNHGQAMRYNDEHGAWTHVEWLGPDRLMVTGSPKSRAFVYKTRVWPVKIMYRVPHGVVVH